MSAILTIKNPTDSDNKIISKSLDTTFTLNKQNVGRLSDASIALLEVDGDINDIQLYKGTNQYSLITDAYDIETTGYDTQLNNLNTANTSYALLRTNPLITGNIKLVVDSKNNMFIDTFKVNDTLSKRKYQKLPVNYKDYYGNNVMACFREVTSDDIYSIPSEEKDLLTVTTDYSKQYNTTYRYGVELNKSKLYTENFALLAPLKVKDVLPDFFLIFKYRHAIINSDNSVDTMSKLLSESELIKSFDFRSGTQLGTYLRRIRKESKRTKSLVYANYNINSNEIFNGISVDKGVVADVYESVQEYNRNTHSQSTSDIYMTEGFKRNRLVASDIINFEFMFDDEDAEMFEMNTYFGVYVKENSIMTDGYFINTEDGTECNDEENLMACLLYQTDDDMIKYIDNDTSIYRINGINTKDDLIELMNADSETGENILSVSGKKLSTDITDSFSKFISFKINKAIKYGEHLRFICRTNSEDYNDTIYELIKSNDKQYRNKKHGLSREIINRYYQGDTKIDIHRIAYYVEEGCENEIEEITKSIYHAINSFSNCPIKCITRNSNSLCVASKKIYDTIFTEYELQRFTSNFYKSKLSNTDGTDKEITYFGDYSVEQAFLTINDPMFNIDVIYTPIHFEMISNRESYIVKFMDIKNTLYEVNTRLLNENIQTSILTYYNNYLYDSFKISYKQIDNNSLVDEEIGVNYIQSINNPQLNMINYDSTLNESKINLHNPKLFNIGLAGFMPIKDFDFAVLHTNTQTLSTTRTESQIFPSGQKLSEPIEIYKDEENLIDYITK